jgi:hypothetical protein
VHLNIAGNRIPDEAFVALFELIKKNKTLRVLDADNNRWTLKHFKSLRDAVMENTGLTDKIVIPFNDIVPIFSSASRSREEIRSLVQDIEEKLRENEVSNPAKPSVKEKKHTKNITWGATALAAAHQRKSPSMALDSMARWPKSPGPEASEEKKFPVNPEPESKPTSQDGDDGDLAPAVADFERIYTLQELQSSSRNSIFNAVLIMLVATLPASVNPKFRELYLTEHEFQASFGVTLAEFEKWPKWKQIRKKRELDLF